MHIYERKAIKDYNYLHFLHEATHQKAYCSSYPLEVSIEVSSFCNARCTHCSSWRRNKKGRFMSLDTFRQVIDQIKHFRPYIAYHLQGEPTLNKNLPKMIRIVNEAGLEDCLTTNGISLNKKLSSEIIDAGVKYVIFSMSAASRDGYKKTYSVDKFEVVLRNLIDFLMLRHERNRAIRVRTVFVDAPHTAREKDKHVAMLNCIPVDCCSISPMFNFYGDNESAQIDLNKMDRKDIPVCKMPWKYFSVNAEGEVRACAFDVYDRSVLGSLSEKDFMEYWNCSDMQTFRQSLLDRHFSYTDKNGHLCSKCNQMFLDVKKDHICTSQWPHDFAAESEKYFQKQSSHLFENMPEEEYLSKYRYLMEHTEEWIAGMSAPVE